MTQLLTDTERDGIRSLQAKCGANAKAKGFWDEGEHFEKSKYVLPYGAAAYRNYVANRLVLIKGELSEAHEELRKGYDPTFEYVTYPPELVAEFGSVDIVAEGFARDGRLPKPEGFPSELADALIRILDTAEELGIDLAAVVEGKMEYNATRAQMHGKKF